MTLDPVWADIMLKFESRCLGDVKAEMESLVRDEKREPFEREFVQLSDVEVDSIKAYGRAGNWGGAAVDYPQLTISELREIAETQMDVPWPEVRRACHAALMLHDWAGAIREVSEAFPNVQRGLIAREVARQGSSRWTLWEDDALTASLRARKPLTEEGAAHLQVLSGSLLWSGLMDDALIDVVQEGRCASLEGFCTELERIFGIRPSVGGVEARMNALYQGDDRISGIQSEFRMLQSGTPVPWTALAREREVSPMALAHRCYGRRESERALWSVDDLVSLKEHFEDHPVTAWQLLPKVFPGERRTDCGVFYERIKGLSEEEIGQLPRARRRARRAGTGRDPVQPWDAAEVERLVEAVRARGYNWEHIVRDVFPNRSKYSVRHRWERVKRDLRSFSPSMDLVVARTVVRDTEAGVDWSGLAERLERKDVETLARWLVLRDRGLEFFGDLALEFAVRHPGEQISPEIPVAPELVADFLAKNPATVDLEWTAELDEKLKEEVKDPVTVHWATVAETLDVSPLDACARWLALMNEEA